MAGWPVANSVDLVDDVRVDRSAFERALGRPELFEDADHFLACGAGAELGLDGLDAVGGRPRHGEAGIRDALKHRV